MEAEAKAFLTKNKILAGARSIALAVSGGADSMALAHFMLTNYPGYEYMIAHVEHGLRPTSMEDMALVRSFAAAMSIPFRGVSVDVPALARERKKGIEETARVERYAFLRGLNCDLILTAHHMDDFAETVLDHMIRGCGQKGLSGIAPLEHGVGRPFLSLRKEALIAYCDRNGLAYAVDETNMDTAFRRNRIRHELLSQLETYNPKITEGLYRMGSIIREEDLLLEELAQSAFASVAHLEPKSVFLDGKALSAQPLALRRRLVLLAGHCLDEAFDFQTVERILALRTGKELPLGKEGRILQNGKGLCFQSAREKIAAFSPISIHHCGTYSTPWGVLAVTQEASAGKNREKDCLFISEKTLKSGLTLRLREAGDRVWIAGVGNKKLSDWFIDAKISKEQRERTLLLSAASRILWVIGERIFVREEIGNIKLKFLKKNL